MNTYDIYPCNTTESNNENSYFCMVDSSSSVNGGTMRQGFVLVPTSLLFRGIDSLHSTFEELVKYLVFKFQTCKQQAEQQQQQQLQRQQMSHNENNTTSKYLYVQQQESQLMLARQFEMIWSLFDMLLQWPVCDPHLMKWVCIEKAIYHYYYYYYHC